MSRVGGIPESYPQRSRRNTLITIVYIQGYTEIYDTEEASCERRQKRAAARFQIIWCRGSAAGETA